MGKELARNSDCEEHEGAVAALFGESMFHDMSTADEDGIVDDYEESGGTVAVLFGKSMFHDMSAADNDGIADDYECTKIGGDRRKDLSRELEVRIKEAVKECFPGENVNGLKEIIW